MSSPRKLLVPRDVEETFLNQAQENTLRGIETCGLLCGRFGAQEEVHITHLLIPPQRGTHNTVEMLSDQLVAMHMIENDLIVIGWIHTHPTQTAFLSSIDVHTQYSYQALLSEAVAVVCAPTYNTNKWLRLTKAGMRIVGGCSMDGFHEHASNSRLFQPALNVSFCSKDVQLVNLREEDEQNTAEEPPEAEHEPSEYFAKYDAPLPGEQVATSAPENPVHASSSTASTAETSRMTGSKLRNISMKIEKAKSHREFLATCSREQLLPRGFHLKWSSHYKRDDTTAGILSKASQDLVAACQRLAGKKLTELKQEFELGWRELSSSLPTDDLNRLSAQLSSDKIRETGRLQRNKLCKLKDLRSRQSLLRTRGDLVNGVRTDAKDDDVVDLDVDKVDMYDVDVDVDAVDVHVDANVGAGEARGEAINIAGYGKEEGATIKPNDELVNDVGDMSDREGNHTDRNRTNTGQTKDKSRRVQVTNLSDKVLSAGQLSLLSKGLGFVPVRAQQVTRLISELREWERLVRLKEYWGAGGSQKKKEGVEEGEGPDKHKGDDIHHDEQYRKSRWTPEKGRDPWLDLYIEEVKRSVLAGVEKTKKGNLSVAEEEAILELMMDKDIIVRPADKGSGVVVMNTKDYWDGLNREVDDGSTYRPTEGDQTKMIYKKVKLLADRLYKQGYIGKHLHRYLIPPVPKAGFIQGNPKLHKEGNPLRVIVSGRGHATEGIAELAEGELATHIEMQPSYVKDTTDFINKVKHVKLPVVSEIKPILFCMDVSKLYPSVPRKEGLAACREALDSRHNPTIPTEEVLEMIKLVLDNNNFSVGNSKHYIQVNGTAIGSKLGRNYACTYLGKWESELLASSELTPFLYLRYVDDIFGIWLHGEDSLRKFHQMANSLHSQIKLDLRHSTNGVEFLDVHVGIREDTLCTDVYTKPTDTKAYLHFTSDHPEHTKSGIPSGLAMRAKRICSSNADFKRQIKDIHNNLSSRGYPRHQIQKGIRRVEGMNRSEILKNSTQKQQKEGIPLVVTYSSHLPNINQILREKRGLLSRSETLQKIFKDKMFVSYKRGTNLRDTLVHKKTKQLCRVGEQTGHCGKNCSVCKVMYSETDKVTGPGKKEACTYDRTIGCKSRNVVYGIVCGACKCVVYVGETGGLLYQRVQNHLSTIRCKRNEMDVAAHFNGAGHQITDAKFVGLEKVWRSWTTYRRVREQRWVGLFGTHQGEGGLNKKTS